MSPPNRFQLLEITVLSAEDLAPVSKSMRTYAVVSVNPDRKLATKVDNRGGHTNPKWNDKFVFRVDDRILTSQPSIVSIDIFAAAWLKDVLIGSVRVPISQLFPCANPDRDPGDNGFNTMRFLDLQVRRPSGRPQGTINIGVQLLDGATRSMPLYTELSASGIGDEGGKEEKVGRLRRVQSHRTDFTVGGESLVTSSFVKGNDGVPKLSDEKIGDGNGSAVNGSLCSDVGPSASVVAAAIAQGIIRAKAAQNGNGESAGSSMLEDYAEENDSVEGLRTKLERWRAELPPLHEVKKAGKWHGNRRRRSKDGNDSKLFSCFGSVFGCQVSITCGGGDGNSRTRRNEGLRRRRVYRNSPGSHTYA